MCLFHFVFFLPDAELGVRPAQMAGTRGMEKLGQREKLHSDEACNEPKNNSMRGMDNDAAGESVGADFCYYINRYQ